MGAVAPVFIDLLDKIFAFLITQTGTCFDLIEKIGFFIASADEKNLILGKRKNGRAQNRNKRDILQGIVDHLQQREHGHDLGGAEIAVETAGIHRYTEIRKHFFIQGRPSFHRAH
ncbi:hypothetical protein SDC9_100215 [bioreactor metagenome]|uniref:Uncharacterized protein n=1 Tax=bioreactor metagenome TaxID=1076179 RepID=A0A645AK85_9ZZZZ